MSSSGKLIVVLMHQSLSARHIDVNWHLQVSEIASSPQEDLTRLRVPTVDFFRFIRLSYERIKGSEAIAKKYLLLVHHAYEGR